MSLFVGNISASVSARDLEALFGKVGKCRVDLRTGQRQSQFALVIFENEKEASSAVASLHQYELGGSPLKVRFASNHSSAAAAPPARSRSPSRIEKQIIQLGPTRPTVHTGVVTLQSAKATTGGSIISLSGSTPKPAAVVQPAAASPPEKTAAAPLPEKTVVASPPEKIAVAAPTVLQSTQQAVVKPAPTAKAAPPSKSAEQPETPSAASALARPEEKPEVKVGVKTEVKMEVKAEVKVEKSEARGEEAKQPQKSAVAPSKSAAPQTVQPPVAKREEEKAMEEQPDSEGLVNVPGKADELRCIPCSKVFKRAARKAHVTSKTHQKAHEVAKNSH